MEIALEWFQNTIGGGSMVNAIAIVLVVVAMIVGTYAIARFGMNEKVAEFTKKLALLDDVIDDLIMFVAYADVPDFEAAELEAAELAEQIPPYVIDARMLYVCREVQRFAEKQWGLKLDLIFVHRRAEKYFQKIKRNPNNGLEI